MPRCFINAFDDILQDLPRDAIAILNRALVLQEAAEVRNAPAIQKTRAEIEVTERMTRQLLSGAAALYLG